MRFPIPGFQTILGPYPKRLLLRRFWPLLFASFFGSLIVAASQLPTGYDWRYRVISNLLSPRDDPQMYWLASLGISLAGLLMLPFVLHFKNALKPFSQRGAAIGAIAFYVGIGALILSALVVPQHTHTVLGIRRLHELFARSSALAIGIGMFGACYCAARDRADVPSALNGWLLWSWGTLTVLPIGGVLICEALLLFARTHQPGALAVHDLLRNSVFWHLGFWEWVGALAVFLFLGIGAWLLPEK